MNYFHQAREVTMEISDVKLLPANQLPAHWDYNYRSLLNYLEQSLYGVRGKITDSATGDPLEAEVFVLNHELDSSWVYSSLPAGDYHRLLYSGTYDIRYSKTGYYPQTFTDVSVYNQFATIIDVELVSHFQDIEEPDQNIFKIYPNPVAGNFVKLNTDNKIDRIRIYALTGEICMQSDGEVNNSSFIDVSMLSPGTYIVQVELDGKSYQQKMIKH